MVAMFATYFFEIDFKKRVKPVFDEISMISKELKVTFRDFIPEDDASFVSES